MSLRVDRGPVWTLTLDRPARANALSADLVEALHDALDEVASAEPEVLVLRGAGRHFAAGFDLHGLAAASDASLTLRFLRIGSLLERLLAVPCPTVAVVEGAAVGAGADLVLACDDRLVAPSVTLRFPGPAFGVVLGVGRRRLLEDGTGLVTGAPDALPRVLAGHRARSAAERAALVGHRLRPDPDAELAALARSLITPGLHARLSAYAEAALPTPAPGRQAGATTKEQVA